MRGGSGTVETGTRPAEPRPSARRRPSGCRRSAARYSARSPAAATRPRLRGRLRCSCLTVYWDPRRWELPASLVEHRPACLQAVLYCLERRLSARLRFANRPVYRRMANRQRGCQCWPPRLDPKTRQPFSQRRFPHSGFSTAKITYCSCDGCNSVNPAISARSRSPCRSRSRARPRSTRTSASRPVTGSRSATRSTSRPRRRRST